MAPRLLCALALGAVTVTACLWPPEYYVVPEPVNYPPVIVTAVADPTEVDGVITFDTAQLTGVVLDLREIIDEDVNDTLYVRWLVAYDPSIDGLKAVPQEIPLLPTGRNTRNTTRTISKNDLDTVDSFRSVGGQASNSRYVVEVLVGDRRPPPGASVYDFGSDENGTPVRVARWRWVISRVSTGGN